MAEEWYYAQDGVRKGPISTEQLKALAADGTLLPDDHIWKEGLADWVPASRTKGLFPEGATASPAPPPAAPVYEEEPGGGFEGDFEEAPPRRASGRPPALRGSRRTGRMSRATETPQRPWTYWVGVGVAGLVIVSVLAVLVWPSKKGVGPATEDTAPRDPSVPGPDYLKGDWHCDLTAVDGSKKKLFFRYLEGNVFDIYVYPEGEGAEPKRLRWGKWRLEGDHLVLRGNDRREAVSRPRIIDANTMQLTASEGIYRCRRSVGGAAPEGGAAPPGEGAQRGVHGRARRRGSGTA